MPACQLFLSTIQCRHKLLLFLAREMDEQQQLGTHRTAGGARTPYYEVGSARAWLGLAQLLPAAHAPACASNAQGAHAKWCTCSPVRLCTTSLARCTSSRCRSPRPDRAGALLPHVCADANQLE